MRTKPAIDGTWLTLAALFVSLLWRVWFLGAPYRPDRRSLALNPTQVASRKRRFGHLALLGGIAPITSAAAAAAMVELVSSHPRPLCADNPPRKRR